MKKHIEYPSIEQFRSVIHNINHSFQFIGVDENGDPIYNKTIDKPTINFKGTVKLHGTNAGVSFNEIEGIWAQSRENIITVDKDNFGFAKFVEENKDIFLNLLHKAASVFDLENNTITIFGEWAGGNIQKGVGISNLEKSFFIFGAVLTPFDNENEPLWLNHFDLKAIDNKIFNINDFETYSIDINFNMPQLVQNDLIAITEAIEKECPVAKAFGFTGLGEGVVWSAFIKNKLYQFKIKGEKHSSSKVKILASVDIEKLNSINEFVDYAVTDNRFNQALENIFPNNEEIHIKKLGDVIRWVINDVIKEESDTMKENNIEPKEVNKYISNKVRTKFINL